MLRIAKRYDHKNSTISDQQSVHAALWSQHPAFQTLLQWLNLVGFAAFGIYLLAATGLLQVALAADRTYISVGILLALAAMSAFCGYRAWQLSREHGVLDRIVASSVPQPQLAGDTERDLMLSSALAQDYLAQSAAAAERGLRLVDVFSDRARDGHEFGWFVTGVMVKAGLVGTIIGFVQMLSSVSQLESFDVSQMQEVLQNMSSGMGVALYTTLVGVSASVLLGLQVLLLDRSADRLVANTVRYASANGR